MGPHLPENSHNTGINGDTNSDEENHLEVPENDGWRIGYEVEMNGIGIVNVYDVGQNADTSDNSCSSDSSEDVDDDDSEAKRAGYRPLLTDAPLKSTEAEAETYEDKYHAGTSKYTWREADKIPHVNLPPIVDKNCYTIPHKPVDIPLDEDKVSQIKLAMSNISLPPPSAWDKNITDKKLADLMQSQVIHSINFDESRTLNGLACHSELPTAQRGMCYFHVVKNLISELPKAKIYEAACDEKKSRCEYFGSCNLL
uniref:General transcription factor IIF subunit 2 n=1 Tax=Ditylenchus dipsaci TaxID=166011 RepID=A0A915DIL9_9BILA